MSSKIILTSMDPAFRNFGLAKFALSVDDLKLELLDLKLLETAKDKSKQVRKNSDSLRRAKALHTDMLDWIAGSHIVCAEIPVGSQSAQAMFAFGVSVGILAACPEGLIQVQPTETKKAAVGTATAAKDEMIDWAIETYPDGPWLRRGGKIIAKNEHLADACAVAHAALKTQQFLGMRSMLQAVASSKNF